MPTIKPRIAITLEPESHRVLRRLGKARGVPMSRIVGELLDAGLPVLGRVAETLERAAKAEASVKAEFRRAVAEAEAIVQPQAERMLALLEELGGLVGVEAEGGKEGARVRAPAAAGGRRRGKKGGTPG